MLSWRSEPWALTGTRKHFGLFSKVGAVRMESGLFRSMSIIFEVHTSNVFLNIKLNVKMFSLTYRCALVGEVGNIQLYLLLAWKCPADEKSDAKSVDCHIPRGLPTAFSRLKLCLYPWSVFDTNIKLNVLAPSTET